MNGKIVILPFFKQLLKKEKKRFASLPNDFVHEVNTFLAKTDKSKHKAELGLYKIRIPITSAKIGKRGGYRTLLLLHSQQLFFPIALYYKREKSVLSDKELKRYLIQAKLEIDDWIQSMANSR